MQPRDPDAQTHPDTVPPKSLPPPAGENDDLAKILKDRVEAQRKLKRKEYEAISKKSFILRSQEDNPVPSEQAVDCGQQEIRQLEGSISQLMKQQRKKEQFLREMHEAPFYSLSRLNYFIHKNPTLFTAVFLESNLLILSYPLQTMKTRVQSRHVKFDLCHYSKNAVEKVRTPRSPAMHKGIGYAYLQTATANGFHYFVTKYFDYFLLKREVSQSYLTRKLLSFTGTSSLLRFARLQVTSSG